VLNFLTLQNEKRLSEVVTYNVGTRITSEGVYGTYLQYQAATNRGLTIQDVLMFSWMNFSSILICLVSKQVAYEDLSELVVGHDPTELSVFMESQLLMLWRSLLQQFSILHEELEALIVEVMQGLVKVSEIFHDSHC
jgi:hypothetical protein